MPALLRWARRTPTVDTTGFAACADCIESRGLTRRWREAPVRPLRSIQPGAHLGAGRAGESDRRAGPLASPGRAAGESGPESDRRAGLASPTAGPGRWKRAAGVRPPGRIRAAGPGRWREFRKLFCGRKSNRRNGLERDPYTIFDP
jgi:hypothetical protein